MGILFGGPTPEDGESAYDSWLGLGFIGSELDYQTWLKGDQGLSAYEVAVDDGYAGTVTAWLASLKGDDGRSAYEVWIDDGHTGSVSDFLTWLRSDTSTIGAVMDWDVITGSTNVAAGSTGKYIKIGKTVICSCSIELISSAGWGSCELPFLSFSEIKGEGRRVGGGGGGASLRNIDYSATSSVFRIGSDDISIGVGSFAECAFCYITTE